MYKKMVPFEPTPEMIAAGHALDPLGCDIPDEDAAMIYTRIWHGMWWAAPATEDATSPPAPEPRPSSDCP